jgi:hypothetical protein
MTKIENMKDVSFFQQYEYITHSNREDVGVCVKIYDLLVIMKE